MTEGTAKEAQCYNRNTKSCRKQQTKTKRLTAVSLQCKTRLFKREGRAQALRNIKQKGNPIQKER